MAGPRSDRKRGSLATVIVTLLLLCVPALPAQGAATLLVTTSRDHAPNGCSPSDCTLREAILASNARPGPDVIKLRSTTYALKIPGEDRRARVGGLDVRGRLTIVGAGMRDTTIRGNWAPDDPELIFRVLARSSLEVRGVTVKNGLFGFVARPGSELDLRRVEVGSNGARFGGEGAGIFTAPGSTTRLTRTRVVANRGAGGIVSEGRAFIRKTLVAENVNNDAITWLAGGITNEGTMLIVRSTVRRNDGAAGGIHNRGTLRVLRSTVRENTAVNGGGIVDSGDFLLVRRSRIAHNGATNHGGGMLAEGWDARLVQATIHGNLADADADGAGNGGGMLVRAGAGPTALAIDSSTLSGNGAMHGGGIALEADGTALARASLIDSTLSSNRAAGDGGGAAALSGGVMELENVTVARGRADADAIGGGLGGGVFVAPGASLSVASSILADNGVAANDEGSDCDGTVTSGGDNIVENPSGCTGLGPFDISGVDPSLGPLARNGGPTHTHALSSLSPALDAAAACDETDQRGVRRRTCDIGSYERVTCHGVLVNRVGTPGADTLSGSPRGDGIYARGGDDRLTGGPGDDALCAHGGDDVLVGGDGRDILAGGPGVDVCRGGPRDELISCERR